MNLYSFNPEIYPTFVSNDHQNNNNNNNNNNDPFNLCTQFSDFSNYPQHHQQMYNCVEPPTTEVPEIPDTCFNYITTLLVENDSEDRPGVTLQDYMTAQFSYNTSLDAALLPDIPNIIPHNHCLHDYLNMFSNCNDNFIDDNNNNYINSSSHNVRFHAEIGNENRVFNQNQYEQQCLNWDFDHPLVLDDVPDLVADMGMYANTVAENTLTVVPQMGVLGHSFVEEVAENTLTVVPQMRVLGNSFVEEVACNDTSGNNAKTRGRDEQVDESRGGEKHLAASKDDDWCDQIEKYGDVLLCPEGRNKPGALCGKSKSQGVNDHEGGKAVKVSRKRGGKGGQVADLRALLTRCAQCVARVDLNGAYELLAQIRQHSSPHGDFLQRVAHYLANGLEARLEGKGAELTRVSEGISSSEVLKANRVFVGSVPYKIMSYYTTNKTIAALAMESSSIHIIDFGIYYGLQWPCIIQNLSKRPNGPPKIRVTGIDFPLSGFRPSERVDETGKCLAMYCQKYNVPFEYNAIAQPWETVKIEDLKLVPNEPLVVNCLYRAHNLFDESVDDSSPRDEFLKLVRRIKPDIFVHGVVNSTASVPFFLNRFKEVMFHYSALFDVFESTMCREDSERLLLESKVYGTQALNVIACESVERVERPETYKQWQVRTQRAGFEQVALDRDLVRRAKAMVKRSFRDEFSYDEDGLWVVQGWKGRILYAISCWKPV